MAGYSTRIIWVLLFCTSFGTVAGQDTYKYMVFFSDKDGSPYTLEQADQFMSAPALERRQNYNIPLNLTDLPLSADYLEQMVSDSFTVLGQSRWLNAALIASDQEITELQLLEKPFVRKVIWAALEMTGGRTSLGTEDQFSAGIDRQIFWQPSVELEYGLATGQLRMLNGQFLHKNGWRGEDMTIAVLDAGFVQANVLDAFASLRNENRIVGTLDLVDGDDDPFGSSSHGTSVLGTMAGDIRSVYLGTAPKAKYLLIRTEDIASEQIVEEFNYVLGLEYADQMGADIISTSLGYTRYNHPEMDHEPADLDGDHLVASIGADLAASKGMIVINSAGNEGNAAWQYTSIPADGDSVLAVGSVNAQRVRSAFSGQGWPLSENIKPNVMAQGEEVAVINTSGDIVLSNGTSFSAPIVAGLTACLWQAFPENNNMEILRAIEQSSSQYLTPDQLSGYGIPDFQAAYALLYQAHYNPGLQADIQVFPNPFSTNITLTLPDIPDQDMDVSLVNDIGQVLFKQLILSGSRKTVNLHFNGVRGLNTGLYFLKIKTSENVFMFKLIKV